MSPHVIGRPDDAIVENLRATLRLWKRNLTPREWISAMQYERRVHRVRPWMGEERRSA